MIVLNINLGNKVSLPRRADPWVRVQSVVFFFASDRAHAQLLKRLRDDGVEVIVTRYAGVSCDDVAMAEKLCFKIAGTPAQAPTSIAEYINRADVGIDSENPRGLNQSTRPQSELARASRRLYIKGSMLTLSEPER